MVSSLPEIRSMMQPVNIIIILTSIHRGLKPGKSEVEVREKGKPPVMGIDTTQAE